MGCLQARYVIAFACTLLNFLFFMMRINLSVAIVAIALPDTFHSKQNAPTYDWNSSQRGIILSSFFWGYTLMHLPYSFIIQRFGPKLTVFVMILLSSLFTVLFVPFAALGWQAACLARILLGFSQAGMMSSVHTLLAAWAPQEERSRMVVYAYNGQQLGTIVALATSGVLSETLGWPSVFYIHGALGILIAGIWLILVENSPALHRLASPQERKYIESSLAAAIEEEERKKHLKTPWRAIMTSIPFYALIAAQCSQAWGFWTLITGIPSYMAGVLGFDLAQNGILSSLPYVAMWCTSLLFGWGADELIKRDVWSINTSRKVASAIGLYSPTVMLTILSFVPTEPATAVTILLITMGLNAANLVGHSPNQLDLSPNFAGVLMATGNTFACTVATVGPIISGLIVTDTTNEDQWEIVFLLTAAIYFVGNTIFITFGSTKVQPWNCPKFLVSDTFNTVSAMEEKTMEEWKVKSIQIKDEISLGLE